MNWKKFVLEYLSFSRRDRIAVISLILLISAIFFIPFPAKRKPDISAIIPPVKTERSKPPRSTEHGLQEKNRGPDYQTDKDFPPGNLFYFDPNTATDEELQLLGFRPKTISIIRHYLKSGGKFRETADLKKIYGLFEDEYERLRPFVKIKGFTNRAVKGNARFYVEPGKTYENRAPSTQNPFNRGTTFPESFSKNPRTIDINICDTNDLKSLPGIGSKLSQRIINFREKLGGFYSVEQVGETFGLKDSVFLVIKKYLKAEKINLRKININSCTVDDLKSHPYIKYAVANAIVSYRNEHGDFESAEDLKNVMVVTEEVFNKILPYLKY